MTREKSCFIIVLPTRLYLREAKPFRCCGNRTLACCVASKHAARHSEVDLDGFVSVTHPSPISTIHNHIRNRSQTPQSDRSRNESVEDVSAVGAQSKKPLGFFDSIRPRSKSEATRKTNIFTHRKTPTVRAVGGRLKLGPLKDGLRATLKKL